MVASLGAWGDSAAHRLNGVSARVKRVLPPGFASVTARFVRQPFDDGSDLADFLAAVAADASLVEVKAAVAWVKRSGIRRVRVSLDTIRARGGTVDLTVGIDEGGGTEQGLRLVLEVADSARVFHDPSGRTFHPKVYLACGDQKAQLLVGSHNLTAGGAYFNYEAGVILELDRSNAADEAVVADVQAYFARLKADAAVCKDLDEAMIAALLADPRYRIGDEDHRRTGKIATAPDAPEDDEDGVVEAGPQPVFGSAAGKMRRDPAPPSTTVGKTTPAGGAKSATKAVAAATATAPRPTSTPAGTAAVQPRRVIRRWNKKMTRSDSGHPRPGSQTTGALRFTQAQQPIDQASWPRQRLFGHLPWQPDARYPGREIVTAQFDMTIHGTHYGVHQLVLKHDARRGAGQANFTTDLKWAQLPRAIRQNMHFDDWVSVERYSDGALHITVTVQAPALGFYDDPIA